MSLFKRLKSESFEGGAKELRHVIDSMRSLAITPVEREFDGKWALELKKKIIDGLAVPFFWVVAEMPRGGKTMRFRVNGQHSSWALEELLKENALPDNLAIHLDTYHVPDRDGAVMLFRQFDARKSARTKEDISGAYQQWHESLRDCKRGLAKLAIEGIVWHRRVLEELPVPSGDDIYQLFDEERLHPFILLMDEILRSGKANELKRTPIIAAAYGTWLDDAKEAEGFWRSVAAGSGRVDPDAATDLDEEIIRIKEEKEKISAGDLCAKCKIAWDAFNNHSRVNSFKVNTKKKGLPKFIAA